MKKYLYGPLVRQMETSKITAKKLAVNLGVDVRAIHRIIDGTTRRLSGEKMTILAKCLAISRSDLCALLARQRDAVRLIRLDREIAAVISSVRWWRAPTWPESVEWAPSRERIESLVVSLRKLSDQNFGLPMPKKLRPLRRLQSAASPETPASPLPPLKPPKKLRPLSRLIRRLESGGDVSQST